MIGERFIPRPESKRINRDQYDAVLFDLDGVITNTATLPATCWKQMFDAYLRERAEQKGEAFRPFDIATDYRLYVDGKPRFDGVRDFLSSRGIQLLEGNRDDPTDLETVHGLGNRKNDLVNRIIEEKGVEPYEGSVKLIHELRRGGEHVAIDAVQLTKWVNAYRSSKSRRARSFGPFMMTRAVGRKRL